MEILSHFVKREKKNPDSHFHGCSNLICTVKAKAHQRQSHLPPDGFKGWLETGQDLRPKRRVWRSRGGLSPAEDSPVGGGVHRGHAAQSPLATPSLQGTESVVW